MKAAYVIFARNKMHLAEHVARCVTSAFAQDYVNEAAPLEIVLSDQGSTDGTLELLQRLAAEYHGPHRVRVLSCPDTAARGMAGMNAHLCWLHDQLDADVFIPSPCDDYASPGRTAALMEAFERTGADMVGTAMLFEDPTGAEETGRTSWTRTGWVDSREVVEHKVGGSAAVAWRTSLWRRVMPIPGLCGVDVWLPPLAAVLGGFWFVNLPLYTYLRHADPANTGLEGALLAAKDEAAKKVIDEHRFFQTAAAYQWVLRRLDSLKVGDADDRNWASEGARAYYEAWLDTRTEMTVQKIAPQPFPI